MQGKHEEGERMAMKKWGALAVTLGIMALIFFLSAQPGEQSGALSEQVAQQMQQSGTAGLLIPAWFSANAYANVRKWAHVYIYFALGASMAVTVRLWRPQRRAWRQGGAGGAAVRGLGGGR